MKILIIEDEPLAQEELSSLILRNFPKTIIAAVIDSVEDSIEWLTNNTPDLIFMDIHLSDGISFDIFNRVEVISPIIFITAYDQYAIQAFEVNGIGYILKPLDESKLVTAIERFQKNALLSTVNTHDLLKQLNQTNKSYKNRLVIKLGDKISYISIDDVAYFYSEDRITFVVHKSGKKQIVDYNIETLESMLNPIDFFRVTRGCIASIGAINKVSKYFNSRLKITLKPEYDKEVLISRINVSKFIAWLDGE